MRSDTYLTLVSAFLGIKFDGRILVNKCCGAFEMMSADGTGCVNVSWPRRNIHRNARLINAQRHEEWLHSWMPTGVPTANIVAASLHQRDVVPQAIFLPINSTISWAEYLKRGARTLKSQAVLRDAFAIRPGQNGEYRVAAYCIDATDTPKPSFVMLFTPICLMEECVWRCCAPGNVLVFETGKWRCAKDSRGYWSPYNSSVMSFLDPETPYMSFSKQNDSVLCPNSQLLNFSLIPGDNRSMELILRDSIDSFFSSGRICTDFQRHDNGTITEAHLYCKYSRITRGVYWMSQPLSFVSALMLTAALIAIGTNKRLRLTAHGWSLGCHAACLLAFNVGQVTYYMTINDVIPHDTPNHLVWKCRSFGLTMYFLLMAAASWLTALSINMAVQGFKMAPVVRSGRSEWKRILALSAFAWALPSIMTSVSVYLIVRDSQIRQPDNAKNSTLIIPSLAETRTCFDERVFTDSFSTHKGGASLFFYGPVGFLIAINIVCLAKTLRQVQYLRRGRSVFRRGQEEAKTKDPLFRFLESAEAVDENKTKYAAHTTGNSRVSVNRIKLYIKMLMMCGSIEYIPEIVTWAIIEKSFENDNHAYAANLHEDHTLTFRVTGYVTDFFKALYVVWLAAPEGGYMGAVKSQVLMENMGWGARRRSRRK